MGLVLGALTTIALVGAVIWAIFLFRSEAADREAARIADAEARRRAELDAALERPGEPLHCMNCDTDFPGPLPDTGCPNCHLATLVVPQSQYRRDTESVTNNPHA